MIDGVSGPRVVRGNWRAGNTSSGSSFSVPDEPAGGAERAPAAGGTSATLMDAMLCFQENDPVLERDRKARRHGQSMLAALAELQRAMVSEGGAGAALARLSDLVTEPHNAADPALASVMSAIRLRVLVELARSSG